MIDIGQNLEQSMNPDAMQVFYTKALYTLRESRKALLRQYSVADEETLLERVARGEPDSAAAYEHYLAARIIEQTRQQLREELLASMKGEAAESVPETSFHLAFKSLLESRYAAHLSEPVRLAQDALLLGFHSGLTLELRYADWDAFSVRWQWEDRNFRLDTFPVERRIRGNAYLYFGDCMIQSFTIGEADADPRAWLTALLDRLLENPTLDGFSHPVVTGRVASAG